MESYLSSVSKLVDEWVENNFSSANPHNAGLYEAMRYSLLAGGKKLRPALLLMGYNLFSKCELDIHHPALPYAAAVEMIHTYSLIHDDLPAMDDDDLRRGKLTNHKVYGEASAILAGDGLLSKAFEIFSKPAAGIAVERLVTASYTVAHAAGPDGMVGGQYADIISQGAEDAEKLDYIHLHKTARLIAGSLTAGGILGGADGEDVNKLVSYGMTIGLAFQIVDDILDVTSTTETLGKPAGSDAELDKLTYTSLHGVEKARNAVTFLTDSAVEMMEAYTDGAELFIKMAQFLQMRSK